MKLKLYLMLVILILFFSLACVSASENNNLVGVHDAINDYELDNLSSDNQE